MKQDEKSIATRVSLVSIFGNIALTSFKLIAGILAHSNVMVSDAVHSASDVVSSLIVIAGVRISGKKADQDHPYGHERFESVAAILLVVILVVVGGMIGWKALQSMINGSYQEMELPGLLALIAAVVSILGKGWMFLYTRKYAKQIASAALNAEAWHHLSDALSSIGALIGIGGALLGVPVLEPLASLVICLLILKAAFDIVKDAINQMVDRSCDKETEAAIEACIRSQSGVLQVDMLQTRLFGNKIYVDTEIRVEGTMTLVESHAIAERVHEALEQTFPQIKHVMVHVNPG